MSVTAKSAREAMKAKARRLAGEKDQKTDSSDWTPAPLLRAEVKTGARPITKPSAKGIGESNAAADTKAAIGTPSRGAFKKGGAVKARVKKDIGGTLKNLGTSGVLGLGGKLLGDAAKRDDDARDQANWRTAQMIAATGRKSGGGVKDKKALGAIDPSPKRGAAQHYKRGGKAGGGSLPSPEEAMRSEERMRGLRVQKAPPQSFSKDQQQSYEREEGYSAADRAARKSGGKKWIKDAIKKPGALRAALKVKEGKTIPAKKLEAAAEKGGKLGQRARLAQTLKRMNRDTGGPVLDMAGMKKASKKAPAKSRGKTNINIVIATGKGQQQPPADVMAPPPAMPIPMPPPPAAMPPAPMPAAGGAAPPGLPLPPARKAGGRITSVAKSYKDMEAGAATGEGRLQKTDIAKLHKGAPARKEGGRISKIAKSYKDMTAGAGDGEGRLQKTDIAKAKRGSSK